MTSLSRIRTPMSDLQMATSQLNRLFDSAFGTWPWNANGQEASLTGNWIPPVDIMEDKDQVLISAELPGVKPENVKISLENNLLTIRGEKQHKHEENAERVHRYERSYGVFERSFQVPSTVDAERITARYEHGVLHVMLPKVERAKPRQITVQVQA